MIDWPRVSELRDEVGAEDFDEVVELFLEEVEEVLTRLKTAPDLSVLEQDLHFLKGSAMSLGFRSFSQMCRDGERVAADGQAESIDLPGIFSSYEVSKTEFTTNLKAKLAA